MQVLHKAKQNGTTHPTEESRGELHVSVQLLCTAAAQLLRGMRHVGQPVAGATDTVTLCWQHAQYHLAVPVDLAQLAEQEPPQVHDVSLLAFSQLQRCLEPKPTCQH